MCAPAAAALAPWAAARTSRRYRSVSRSGDRPCCKTVQAPRIQAHQYSPVHNDAVHSGLHRQVGHLHQELGRREGQHAVGASGCMQGGQEVGSHGGQLHTKKVAAEKSSTLPQQGGRRLQPQGAAAAIKTASATAGEGQPASVVATELEGRRKKPSRLAAQGTRPRRCFQNDSPHDAHLARGRRPCGAGR